MFSRAGSALTASAALLIAACSLGAQDVRASLNSMQDSRLDVAATVSDGMIGNFGLSRNWSANWLASQEPPVQQPGVTPQPAQSTQQPALPDAPKPAAEPSAKECKVRPCPMPIINWYKRFEDGPQVKPMTPKEKGWLATRNLLDVFNLITILGTSGISVAADSHSAYGPGMPGFARNVGVSFTQDLTGEFFNTFLIPSVMHQDPHYHRTPHASYKRRVFHAIAQVVWTQGDDGKGMLNYGNLVGFAIDDEIGNLYVPGRQTDAGATAQRYAIGLATAPIDNFITEFLPDVASHIHVQIVVVQRIINQIASKDSGGF